MKLLTPTQWILLALMGLCFALALLLRGGLPLDEKVPGLHAAVYSAPPASAETKKQLAKLSKPLKTAAYAIKDNKDRKGEPAYKTGIEASLCRAKYCKTDLVGTGICHGGENEDIANCYTKFLRDTLKSEDYQLDDQCPDHPGKTWREVWFDTLMIGATEAERLSQ